LAPLSPDRLALLRATLAAKGLAQPRVTALPRRADPSTAPLSWAQERLYFLELFQPGTALYNDALRVTLDGPLDPERLDRAWARLAARHEILRTTFELAGDGPRQRIHAPREPRLRRTDLSELRLGASALEARAAELARAEACEPFALEEAPPWRVSLARLTPERWQLVVTMHHILSDGASMGLFFDELARLYADDADRLEPLAVQFGDYAAWERAGDDEARVAADLEHWRALLGPAGEPPPFHAARGTPTGQGAQVPLELDARAVAALEELARRTRTTTNQLLLGAWLALLSEATGATQPCTGIARSLRTRRELEPLIGFFVQSLPLGVDLAGDPTFLELADRARQASLDADAHAAPAFDRIARAVRPPRAPGVEPVLVRGFFSHMRGAIRAPDFPGMRAAWEFVDPGIARFELALVLHESADGLRGFLEHDLGVLGPEVAGALAADYRRLVETLIERPETRLSEARPRARTPREPLPRLRRAAGG